MKYIISVMIVNMFNNMKKTQLISLSSYCKVDRPWDVQDLIKEAVRKEDVINHIYVHPEIPKLSKPNIKIKESVGLWNFITGCLP